jgi:glucose/arabinose dehydrogenase
MLRSRLLWASLLWITAILDSQGQDLFVTEVHDGQGVVYRYTPDGNYTIFSTNMWNPSGVAFDSEGRLYVTAIAGSTYRYASDGSSVYVGPGGECLAIANNGTIFVRSPTFGKNNVGVVSAFKPGGQITNTYLITAHGSIAISRNDELFVTDVGGLYRLMPDGSKIFYVDGSTVAFDQDDNLYFGSGSNLYETALTTPPNPTLIATNISGELTVDNSGNIFAVDFTGGAIKKVTPTGQVSTFATGLQFSRGIASPPKPSLRINLAANQISLARTDFASTFQLYATTNLQTWFTVRSSTLAPDAFGPRAYFRLQAK